MRPNSGYLDYNATAPLDEAVVAAMLPWLSGQQGYGNPSSSHEQGRAAKEAMENARSQVALALGAQPSEIIFTASGTEADNLFIQGAAVNCRAQRIAISTVEHAAVAASARLLQQRFGWKLLEFGVDADGALRTDDYQRVLQNNPGLISCMMANNETGVIYDVVALAQAASELTTKPCFHTDAVQALGKIPIDFRHLNNQGIHALSVSAHKIGGPKGVAALVCDKRVDIQPLLAGGGQERGLRSGTENIAAIVGFGVAIERAAARLHDEVSRLSALRLHLEQGLQKLGAKIFSAHVLRLPNTVYFALPGIDGETLVGELDRAGFALSSGAACSSVKKDLSAVLAAMGVNAQLGRCAVRASLGEASSAQGISDFLSALQRTSARLYGLSAIAA